MWRRILYLHTQDMNFKIRSRRCTRDLVVGNSDTRDIESVYSTQTHTRYTHTHRRYIRVRNASIFCCCQ